METLIMFGQIQWSSPLQFFAKTIENAILQRNILMSPVYPVASGLVSSTKGFNHAEYAEFAEGSV
jgi:hypothetical protein